MTRSESEFRSEARRYGHRQLRVKGDGDESVIRSAVLAHHYDVALCLAASKGVRLGQPEIVETEGAGGTWVGWEADGFTSTSLVKWKAEPIDPTAASRDDLLLAYDRLDREHRALLSGVTALAEAWSADTDRTWISRLGGDLADEIDHAKSVGRS